MSYKKEVIDALEVYKKNTAHVLGDDSDMARAIDRCIVLATEIEEDGWAPISEALPKPVNAQPTIKPERKTGRWIKDRLTALNGGSYEVFRCSECQSAFNWRMGYCGHCGAKMEDDDIPMEYFENGGI